MKLPDITTRFALVRGINVGGNRKVAMADLRELLTCLGLAEPRSLMQSGNLVFRSNAPAPDLERLLAKEAASRLGLETDFFVRSAAEWKAIIAANPFPAAARRDPSHLVVMFLKEAPPPKSVAALRAAVAGPEVIAASGRQAYIVYPDGIGRSRLTPALIEAKLGTRGTGRNWNTVLKLAAL